MITKFESYNESWLFKKENDDQIKALFKEIKDNFDMNKLNRSFRRFDYTYVFTTKRDPRYKNIVEIIPDHYIAVKHWSFSDEIYVDDVEISDISKYLSNDIYWFFQKKYEEKQKIEKKIEKEKALDASKSVLSKYTKPSEPSKKFSLPSIPKPDMSKLKKFLD